MHITVNVNNPDVEAQELQLINLDVPPDMTLADLRSSIEAEGIPGPSQNIYHNGQLITDNSKTLRELDISDGDMLALHVRDMRGNTGVAPAHREPQRRQPAALAQDPELIRLQVLGDARLRGELERANPQLAAALENPQRFAQIFRQSADQQEEARRARMREIEALNNDEFNPESQAKIEDMIRQQGVMENLQNAMEYNPECKSCRSLDIQAPGSDLVFCSFRPCASSLRRRQSQWREGQSLGRLWRPSHNHVPELCRGMQHHAPCRPTVRRSSPWGGNSKYHRPCPLHYATARHEAPRGCIHGHGGQVR
ncbi:hypothetical protein F5Y00DRAFT_97748 [Daldinia vernicosa]|uniref:uncharacterized protein n=1 Tax=Daldinia vernicosa TaxID=114800 RepID=UPI002007AFB4|nr:uncharacterized protein F5Y00DRAFT_97748 [Daldinia vernicosa]KAI0848080.1 hypothetical protein F5Y00DRAFT_97748 [Daldinia vernicosa]